MTVTVFHSGPAHISLTIFNEVRLAFHSVFDLHMSVLNMYWLLKMLCDYIRFVVKGALRNCLRERLPLFSSYYLLSAKQLFSVVC